MLLYFVDKEDAFDVAVLIDITGPQCPSIEIENPTEGQPVTVCPPFESNLLSKGRSGDFDATPLPEVDLDIVCKAKRTLEALDGTFVDISAEEVAKATKCQLGIDKSVVVIEKAVDGIGNPILSADFRSYSKPTRAVAADKRKGAIFSLFVSPCYAANQALLVT